MEDRLGKLTPGYYADLVVLDRDIFQLPEESLLEVSVNRVMVSGQWEFWSDLVETAGRHILRPVLFGYRCITVIVCVFPRQNGANHGYARRYGVITPRHFLNGESQTTGRGLCISSHSAINSRGKALPVPPAL